MEIDNSGMRMNELHIHNLINVSFLFNVSVFITQYHNVNDALNPPHPKPLPSYCSMLFFSKFRVRIRTTGGRA